MIDFINRGTDDLVCEYLRKSREGLVPKKVMVEGHTTKNGSVKPYITTVYVSPDEAKTNSTTVDKDVENLDEVRKQIDKMTPMKMKDMPLDFLMRCSVLPSKGYANYFVDLDPDAKVLWVGFDSKGRPQVEYSAKFKEEKTKEKWERTRIWIGKQSKIEEHINKYPDADVRDCMTLILYTGLRPGSKTNTQAKVQAYGASTLQGKHVKIIDGKVFLDFIGKKGVHQYHEITNPKVAAMLKRRKRKAGANGDLFPVQRNKLNDCVAGIGLKVKDLRTIMAGTLAQKELKNYPNCKTLKEYKEMRNAVGDTVCEVLGNRREESLNSYIYPELFNKHSKEQHSVFIQDKKDRAEKSLQKRNEKLKEKFGGNEE